MPRITVALSVYNGAATLRPTLESAFAQTYKDFEVLVLDDGSTDKSGFIAAEFDVRLIRQENKGRGFALKRLVEESRGDWIALLDADDLWESEKLQMQMDAVQGTDAALIHCDGQFHYPNGRIEDRVLHRMNELDAFDHILPSNRIIAASAMFRRDAMLDVGNFDERTWSACDWYGWLLLASKYKFAHLPEKLVHYNIREGSIANKGASFQEGKLYMLKELILPQVPELLKRLPLPEREKYLKMLTRNIGVAASSVAKYKDREGKKEEARELHKEAMHLASGVPRVWLRAIRSYLK